MRPPRLLVLERRAPSDRGSAVELDLASALAAGDLLVLNDSATLPASLAGTIRERAVEVRLARRQSARSWTALLFGPGDYRTTTEERPPPPSARPGDRVRFAVDFWAQITSVDASSHGRFVDLTFDHAPAGLIGALYRHGRPVQYAHTSKPYELWDVQNVAAGPPWSVEPPSAGRILSAELLARLRERGVRVATLTHAAGLSSTGDAMLDARLPLPERFAIPLATADAVRDARRLGARVVAVGTTTFRALESAALPDGNIQPIGGETDLVVTRAHQRLVVDGLITGLHEEGSSHFRMLESLFTREELTAALEAAARAGLRPHEHGDALLLLAPRPRGPEARAPACQSRFTTRATPC